MPELGQPANDPRQNVAGSGNDPRGQGTTSSDPRGGVSTGESGTFADAVWSAMTREMVGSDPSEPARRFAEENPGLGMLAKVSGMAPYYITPLTRVGMQGIRSIPFVGRGVKTGDRLISEGRTALGTGARDMGAIGAMELGRLGTTAAIHGPGSEETGTVAWQGMTELAITGGVGAAIGHFRKALPPAGRSVELETQIQQFDPKWAYDAPPQMKLQHVKELLESRRNEISDGFADSLTRYKKALRSQSRKQTRILGEKETPIGKIDEGTVVGGRGRQLQDQLRKRWKIGDSKHWQTRRLDAGSGKRALPRDRFNETIAELDMPNDWEAHAFFPVITTAQGKQGARSMQNMLNKFNSSVKAGGHQTWIQREKGEGPFIMIRRTEPDTMRDVQPGDRFLMMKTDEPDFWAKDLSGFGRVMASEAAHFTSLMKSRPSASVANRMVDDAEAAVGDAATLTGEISSGKNSAAMRGIAERLLGKERVGELAEAGKGSTDFVGKIARELVIPTISRYLGPQGNAIAGHTVMVARATHDRLRAEATKILFGAQPRNAKTAIYKDLWSGARHREEGLLRKVDNLSKEAMKEVSDAISRGMSPQDVLDANMSQGASDFLSLLNRVDRKIVSEYNRTMREIGRTEMDPLMNHYMITRMWKGNLRLPITNQKGHIVAVASGRNKKEVLAEANKLKHTLDNSDEISGKVSFNPSTGAIKHADEGTDLSVAANLGDRFLQQQQKWLSRVRTPGLRREMERKGIKGFEFEDTPMSHQELRKKLTSQIREMYQTMASRTIDERMAHRLTKLRGEDPENHRRAVADINAMSGQRGDFTAMVETQVDRVLEPIVGKRASEIARFGNEAMFHLTLGMMNVGFAALNAVQTLQTALPEAAYLLRAAPSAVRARYGYNIVNTPSGGTEVVRTLDPLRMMKRGFEHMNNPSDELWGIYQRARDEGRIAPVLAEEVFGPNADLVGHFRGFFQGNRTFLETMREISAYLPARSEELSRGMALSMGYEIGKNFYKLNGENLYNFAARFVDNTHFRYSASDRAVMLRGAFGSMFGLFKSWMTHYIANMSLYAGDAWRNNNWGALLWSQAGTMSIAGVSGTALLPVAQGINNLFSDKELVENLYNDFGYAKTDNDNSRFIMNPRDAIWDGLPAFLNVSLGQRANVPGADIPNDIEQLYSIMHYDRAVAIGDFIGGSFDAVRGTGQHPANSNEVRTAFARAFMPRVGQAMVKRTEEGAIQSMRTQNRLISDVTWADSVIDAFGFTPNRLNRAYQSMDILFERQQREQELVGVYSEQMAQAMADNDHRQQRTILKRAMEDGMGHKFDSILAGADSRIAKRDEDLLERMFDEDIDRGLTGTLGLSGR